MDKLILAVGTTSELKLSFLKEVLNEIGVSYELIPTKANSNVPDQPITEQHTLTGSMNRAKEAVNKTPQAEAGLGIEVGYQKEKNKKYEMFCYSTIAEKNGNVISCCCQEPLTLHTTS